jgi:hypothetical protein
MGQSNIAKTEKIDKNKMTGIVIWSGFSRLSI